MGSSRTEGQGVFRRALAAAGLTGVVLLTLGVSNALAQQVISSAGPINNIWLTGDLGCQATHTGDASNEFFGGTGPGACGTFLVIPGSGLYGPSVPGGPPVNPYSPLSQSAVTGTGTSSDPYQVVTQVGAYPTGVTVTQTDRYIVGFEAYRTDITVYNYNSYAVTPTVYHAGDCYLQGTDYGYGWLDPSRFGIYCSANPNNSPAGRILGFQQLTGSNAFVEGYYSTVWGDMTPLGFPNTCDCTTFEDNGAGLSWTGVLPPFTYSTLSLLTIMSPAGSTTTPTPLSTTPTSGATTGSVAPPGSAPSQPVLGKSVNAKPVSGQVYVKLPGSAAAAQATHATNLGPQFVPLTAARNLPAGTQFDTRAGTVSLSNATGKKKGKKLQNATLNGAIFSFSQTGSGKNKGLVTLKMLEGAFPGAPSYASCTAKKAEAGPQVGEAGSALAQIAISKSALSTLRVRSSGSYSSRGHYGSATSRGTAWTITDRCDGTLISVQKDVVIVRDFVRHKTITLRAGRRYLAKK